MRPGEGVGGGGVLGPSSQFCVIPDKRLLAVESAITFITKPKVGGACEGGPSRGTQEEIIRDSMLSMTSSAKTALHARLLTSRR